MRDFIQGFFSERSAVFSLFCIGLVAHLVVFYALMLFYGPCVFFLSNDCKVAGNDTQHYVVIANNLAHGNGYSRFVDSPYESDALRTPLLPLYFTPFAYFGGYGLIWLAMIFLNILLSLLGPLVYKLAHEFLAHKYALAAGLICSLEPLYLYRSQIAEPDALLVLLITAALYFLIRSWKKGSFGEVAICASLLGLAILAKPTALYLAALCLLFEIVHLAFFSDTDRSGRVRRVIVMFGIILLIVFPWLARNKMVFGVADLSSVQGYNLYEYYTKDIRIEGDQIPLMMYAFSREPSRYLPLQKDFIHVSLERIKQHPKEFARDYLVGVFRNLFVSDISAIYYYGHTKILPFPYNPESSVNFHAFVSSGNIFAAFKALFHSLPKLVWVLILFVVYAASLAGWFFAWRRDKYLFFVFALFFGMYAYLILSSGPYVEAKYRLPALPLILIMALYGVSFLQAKAFFSRLKAILR